MSTLFITNIAGTGTYAVPTNDTELANAQAGLAALLGGVAGLTFNAVLAWVDINSGTTTRILNCFVSNYQYNGEICPDDTEFAAMVAAINAALVADPNITSASVQYSNLESSPTSPPAPHEASHLSGGSDAISSVAGLTGLLATPQTPAAHNLGGAEHNADTLANLNLKISDATLVDGSPVSSNLWNAPAVVVTPDNVEFDQSGDLPGAFSVYNVTANAPAAFTGGTPNVFTASAGLKVTSNQSTRPSWGFFQSNAGGPLYYAYRPYTALLGSLPHAIIARVKFNSPPIVPLGDMEFGIGLFGQAAGAPDVNNYLIGVLRWTAGAKMTVRGAGFSGGVPAFGIGGAGVEGADLSYEYIALQVTTTNDLNIWAGTSKGDWYHFIQFPLGPIIPFYHGFVIQNGIVAGPIWNAMAGADFMRFYPGDTTFIF